MEDGRQDKALWMKAFVDAQGDTTKQTVLYAQIRLKEERVRHEAELAKHDARVREAAERARNDELYRRLAALPGRLASVEGLKEVEFDDLVEKLIQQKLDLNQPLTLTDDSLLHIAAKHNYYDAIRRLLRNGAQIRARNAEGKTPLDLAVRHHSEFAVSLLMEAER